jgi:hypothetical protein
VRRLLRDFSELTRLIIVLGGFFIMSGHRGLFRSRGFISGECFRLRPAVNYVVIGFLVFKLGSGFSFFSLLGDGWLARETLKRVLIDG